MSNTKIRYCGGVPIPTDEEYDKWVKKLVKEGKRIGKTPWSCDIIAEHKTFEVLNAMGNYPQETMEETCKRRKIESFR
jgi:hypothetical protein